MTLTLTPLLITAQRRRFCIEVYLAISQTDRQKELYIKASKVFQKNPSRLMAAAEVESLRGDLASKAQVAAISRNYVLQPRLGAPLEKTISNG